MTSRNVWRPLALAGVLSAIGAVTAAAQTVVIRGVPAGSSAEVVQGASRVTGAPDAGGDAVLTGALTAPGETRVNFYTDICETVRRLVIVDRDAVPPPAGPGCARTPIAGVFVIQPISTIVINTSGTTPSVLLRQGPFDFRATQTDGGTEPPAGLVIFGGGGYGKLHEARDMSCGGIAECPGSDTGFGFGGGIGFWFTPYAGLEASYYKPKRALFEGAVGNSLFQTTLEPQVLMFVAKLGVPAGPMRIYAMGGATWHRATIRTTQEGLEAIEDEFELRTAGWGWTFGGGVEAWLAPAVAIYAEGGRAALKGGGIESFGEGKLDERMTFAIVGLKVSLNR